MTCAFIKHLMAGKGDWDPCQPLEIDCHRAEQGNAVLSSQNGDEIHSFRRLRTREILQDIVEPVALRRLFRR